MFLLRRPAPLLLRRSRSIDDDARPRGDKRGSIEGKRYWGRRFFGRLARTQCSSGGYLSFRQNVADDLFSFRFVCSSREQRHSTQLLKSIQSRWPSAMIQDTPPSEHEEMGSCDGIVDLIDRIAPLCSTGTIISKNIGGFPVFLPLPQFIYSTSSITMMITLTMCRPCCFILLLLGGGASGFQVGAPPRQAAQVKVSTANVSPVAGLLFDRRHPSASNRNESNGHAF